MKAGIKKADIAEALLELEARVVAALDEFARTTQWGQHNDIKHCNLALELSTIPQEPEEYARVDVTATITIGSGRERP